MTEKNKVPIVDGDKVLPDDYSIDDLFKDDRLSEQAHQFDLYREALDDLKTLRGAVDVDVDIELPPMEEFMSLAAINTAKLALERRVPLKEDGLEIVKESFIDGALFLYSWLYKTKKLAAQDK